MAIITGTNGDDQYPRELEGTESADQIFGLAGHDVLIGFGGNDTLEGGAGADQLFGSNGFDHASYRGSGQGVYIDLRTGTGFSGDATGDTFYGIEGVIGSAYSDQVLGTDGRNILRGEGGSDLLKGYGGTDQLFGGKGSDSLVGGAGADELRGDAGFDYVAYGSPRRRSGSTSLPARASVAMPREIVCSASRAFSAPSSTTASRAMPQPITSKATPVPIP